MNNDFECNRQSVPGEAASDRSLAGAQWREAVRVFALRQKVRTRRPTSPARADPHRRETLPVQSVRPALHLLHQPQGDHSLSDLTQPDGTG